jgi:hypothetical protein
VTDQLTGPILIVHAIPVGDVNPVKEGVVGEAIDRRLLTSGSSTGYPVEDRDH